MTRLGKRNEPQSGNFIYPVNVAQKFISLYQQVLHPNEEQSSVVAAAHYSLASQQNISLNRSKMHVNSAISLLKKINAQERKDNWHSQIARAYAKRAELLEEKSDFPAACLDYQRACDALHLPSSDYDRLLFAQCSISIADLIINEQIDANDLKTMNLGHPLLYVNRALDQITEIVEIDDNVLTTQAYGLQIAGIILGENYFEDAIEAYETAVLLSLKTESLPVTTLLADIYACYGMLYEERLEKCPIKKVPVNLIENAMIYFGMSLLFCPDEQEGFYEQYDEKESDFIILESLFEMIYRVLDPYLIPISPKVTRDLIDALIHAYLCVIEKELPNNALTLHLNNPSTLNTFAQHIYWLVQEYYRKTSTDTRLLDIASAHHSENTLHWQDIYDDIERLQEKPLFNSNNIVYLKNLT